MHMLEFRLIIGNRPGCVMQDFKILFKEELLCPACQWMEDMPIIRNIFKIIENSFIVSKKQVISNLKDGLNNTEV